jgi:DMSO reductase anchor subunit
VKLGAADAAEVTPQPAHWPLVLMLVLTQASVGATAAALFEKASDVQEKLLWISTVSASLGLGASVFHLGRPLGAWRAFLNLKRSWMSREIIAFGLYFGLLASTSTAAFFEWWPGGIGAGILVAAVAGFASVFCSAMIYADTRRDLWFRRRSVSLFSLTTILLGAAASLLVSPTSSFLISLLVMATTLKLGVEILVLRHASASSLTPMKKSALLATGRFQPVAFGHLSGLVVGGIGIPVLLSTTPPQAQWLAAGALLLLLIAELGERYLFFRCVVAPKMPGGMK